MVFSCAAVSVIVLNKVPSFEISVLAWCAVIRWTGLAGGSRKLYLRYSLKAASMSGFALSEIDDGGSAHFVNTGLLKL